LLSVLHTTFGPNLRSTVQVDIVRRLIRQSATIVVLTDASKEAIEALYGGRIEHIVVVPHGIPDHPYVAPPVAWAVENHKGVFPLRLITLGFFREDKGLEAILYALRDLRDCGHTISYRIAGEPQQQFRGQASYRARIEALIESLELGSTVQVDCRYLSVAEQAASIQLAHLGIFGYQDRSHSSSGTMPLVMGMGRPILCTPFEYAKAKAQEGPGVFLAAGFDPAAIAITIEQFMRVEEYTTLATATYKRTRPWVWAAIGAAFGELYLACG